MGLPRRRPCARSSSCASKIGIIASCANASMTAIPCALLRTSTASASPSMMLSTAPSNRLTPATMQAINQTVVQTAVQLGLEDGKRSRVDTTVVETDIHFPTDATLLWDTVRTVTRLIEDLHELLPRGVQGFTNRTRSARRRMQALERMTAQERNTQQEPKYRELLGITGQVLENTRQVVKKTGRIKGMDVMEQAMVDQLCKEITAYCELG